ncbi:RNA exonuclease 4 [Perognathus longimembris pacificus]|uniref:RNA exonuclease 4 n=1 Tax=Perognathus longimembris pacificus TaxID=214514 RepID=UPI002018A40D|nr:RNA exonuclease 4 [Perognathus longimembris pacificus]
MRARAPTAERAPRPAARTAPRKKPRTRFRKKKAPGASGAAGAPPRAPEDFSRNWKALRELLKQKSQAPEEPLVRQTDVKKQPQIVQRNGKESSDASKGGHSPPRRAQAAAGVSVASARKKDRLSRAPSTEASGAERQKGAKRRTDGAIFLQQGAVKPKKRKAEEAAVALTPAPPTEKDIWFDGVDPVDIEAAMGPEAARIARRQLGQKESSVSLVKEQAFSGLTRALAMDCEMVGVGPTGEDSIVARVSLVNQYGKCVYDKYVRPTEPVTDYRTAISGIRPEDLKQGEKLDVVKREVAEMLKGRILVGHALHSDLKVLFLDHPKKKIRDTQKYKPFKARVKSGRPSLKLLSEKILGLRVQQAEHCSVQDAQAAMRLYIMVRKEWENTARDRRPPAAAPARRRDAA